MVIESFDKGGLHLIEESSLILTVQGDEVQAHNYTITLPGKTANSVLSCPTFKHLLYPLEGHLPLISSQLGAHSECGPTSSIIHFGEPEPGPRLSGSTPPSGEKGNWG